MSICTSYDFSEITCDCHFLHFSFSPLKVGTPLSALTPAPVMIAICLALENTLRNSDMSKKVRGKTRFEYRTFIYQSKSDK